MEEKNGCFEHICCTFGAKIISLGLTDSTNLCALEYAEREKPTEPIIFIAEEQSAGRGRLGRAFLSPKGGIYITVLTKTEQGGSFLALTTHAANAVCRALERVVGIKPGIKWVNDIYADGKKLAGILAQGYVDPDTGRVSHVAMGIGLNVEGRDLAPEISQIATTLELLGKVTAKDILAAQIAEEYLATMDRANSKESKDEYRSRSIIVGREVRVLMPDKSFNARVTGITDECALEAVTESGERITISSGDVSIRFEGDTRGADFGGGV